MAEETPPQSSSMDDSVQSRDSDIDEHDYDFGWGALRGRMFVISICSHNEDLEASPIVPPLPWLE